MQRSAGKGYALPPIAESGAPGFQSSGWFGVLAAAGTPPEIIRKLNAEITGAMRQADMREAGIKPD